MPFPTPGDLLNPEIKPTSLASPALAGEFFIAVPPGKTYVCVCVCIYIYIYHYFFKSKGTVYQCIGMINRLIDRKMNPLLIVPVKQEYKINEEKIKTI